MSFYIYQQKNTIIHNLDPRTKIFFLVVSFILGLFYQHPLYILMLVGFVLLYGLIGGVLGNIKRVCFLIFVITVFTTVVWSFFAKGRTPLFYKVSYESLLYGIGASLKINLMIISGVIFLSTCRNEEVTLGLIKLGMPYVASFSFGMALRLAPTFLETSSTITEAQKSRGLELDETGILKKFKNYFALLGPIFLTTIRHANGLSMALESKGFDPHRKRSSYMDLKMKWQDYFVIFIILTFLLINIYFVYKGFGEIDGLIL